MGASGTATPPGPLSVSDMTARIKGTLEESLPYCWIMGEVSDVSRPGSGHCYLTLRDHSSQLSCVMFRFYAQQLRFIPQVGTQVLAYGNISVYERGGRYQFYAVRLRPAGVGDRAIAHEQLRARLEEEGLFDVERKRALPQHPHRIGVVTSPTGAAIRDIIQILSRRAPGLQIILAPTRVQGDGAAELITAAIQQLNRFGGIDIIIVGRGGGSPEDLWPFSDEAVARAIFASNVPVVSAVGHEADRTIADDVADVRAPTPSAAAELVAQEAQILHRRVAELRQRLTRGIDRRLDQLNRELAFLDPLRRLERLRDRADQQSQRLDEARVALAAAADDALMQHRQRLSLAALRLSSVNPLASLARGYAYCERDGRPVHAVAKLQEGERLRLRFADGAASTLIEKIEL